MSEQYVYTIILATIAILLLLIGFIAVLLITYRQKLKQQSEVAKMRLAYEQELRQVSAEVSEYMMERFAQELHDNVGHILTIMRLQIENKKLDAPELEPAFQPIEMSLDDASKQLKLLSRSLNTDYVNNIGLRAAIEIEVEKLLQLRRVEIKYLASNGNFGLDMNQELMVFRIFQEMIHNTMKHSKARNIVITVQPGESLFLKVQDDGRGFDLDETMNSSRSSGLGNMRKRAQLAGLECLIETSLGAGCIYTISKQIS